jgi:hypothetical protein
MDTSPIYVLSPQRTGGSPPEFSSQTVLGPHLIALGGANRTTRQHLIDLLSRFYEDDAKRIRAEDVLFGAGALAGAAARETVEQVGGEALLCRMAGRGELPAKPEKKVVDAVKDMAAHEAVVSAKWGALSVWRIVAGGLMHDGVARILDPKVLFESTLARKGTPGWGIAFGPAGVLPRQTAFASVERLWPLAQPALASALHGETAVYEIASAAQIFLHRTRTVLDPMTAAALVVQGAVATAMDGRRYRAGPLH